METVDFRYLPLTPGDRVLDLGCGEGRHVMAAAYRAPVLAVGVDLCLADLQRAQAKRDEFAEWAQQPAVTERAQLLQSNALQLPFADHCFDKVICSEVLEHIPDYAAALAEIVRVLKPGGLLCVSVPRRWPERICWWLSSAYHQVEGGHLRIFQARALRREIEQQGLQHYRRHWAHALHVPYWWLKCLWWEGQERSRLIALYHRFLVWDLLNRPWLTRTLERLLNPVMGKSVVLYFQKEVER